MIVVDDGSRDGSAAVAARYPVRVIGQEHAGVCTAANRGVAASRGDLVMRLDADDVLAPTYVEETARSLEFHPEADFAYTELRYVGDRGGPYDVADFDPETLAERNYVHASALMRRTSFDHAGGYREDMATVRCEDWDLWLSFAERGLRGILVRKPLLFYRQHASGGRNRPRLSPAGLGREIRMAARLQDHHPVTFAPPRLLRRLSTLPGRVLAREVPPRRAALLVAFYGVMLLRAVARRSRAG